MVWVEPSLVHSFSMENYQQEIHLIEIIHHLKKFVHGKIIGERTPSMKSLLKIFLMLIAKRIQH
jgi:hypothetical protein